MVTKLQIWGAEISQDRAGEYVQQNCHVWCPKWILFKSPSVCWLKQGIPNLWMMKTQLIQQRVYNPEKNHQPTIIYQSTSSFMISYVEWLKRLKSLFSVNHNISHDLWFLGSVTVRSLICPDLLVKSREMPSFAQHEPRTTQPGEAEDLVDVVGQNLGTLGIPSCRWYSWTAIYPVTW